MKCLKCENDAKWKSTKYTSPLCSKCARLEVDALLATGEYDPERDEVKFFYELISKPAFVNGSTQTPNGNLIKLNKLTAMK